MSNATATLTEGTAKVLASLRAAVEYDAQNGFGAVYLDNAIPDGMTRHQFAGHLADLEKRGLYIANSDPDFAGHWGEVKSAD